MASNKKWMVAGSITLLILFGASMGIGAWIGTENKPADNYIDIYLDGEKIDAPIDLGTDSTSDETKASMLEAQFYSAALVGSLNNSESVDNVRDDLSIYNSGSETDWALPYIVTSGSTDIDSLQQTFVNVKFLTDTESSSVYTYLVDLASTADDKVAVYKAIKTLMKEAETNKTPYPEVTGLDVVGEDYSETWTAIQSFLKEDSSYIGSVQKDILVYTYLWQTPSQSAYDTIFTRELVYSQPSIVYSMTIDGEKVDSAVEAGGAAGTDYTALSTATDVAIDAVTWNGYMDDFKNEEGVLTDESITENTLPLDGSFQGYDGIKFGTSAGSNVSSDWTDWENTYISQDDVTEGSALTKNGAYSNEDILNNANLYLADNKNGSDGEGAVIFNTTTDSTDPEFGHREGERNVYAYSQLYPFVFRNVENADATDESSILGSETFSLFADGDATAGYTPAEDIDEDTKYIFDIWFNDKDKALVGEIYIAEQLVSYTTSLTSKALRYWNNQGYYIDLSGEYEDSLASYLPEEILYDEE